MYPCPSKSIDWSHIELRVPTGQGRRLPRVLLIGLLAFPLLLGAAPSKAQPAVRQVLGLQSFDRGNVSVDHFTSNFRVDLDRRADGPVNVVQVVVGPTGFVGAPGQAAVDYIRATFVDRPKPDLIVTVAGPAAQFARKYRQQLFPDTPMLLASVDRKYPGGAPLLANEAAVADVNDYPRVIVRILQCRSRSMGSPTGRRVTRRSQASGRRPGCPPCPGRTRDSRACAAPA